MDPITALAAFAPLLVDAGKGLIARFVAPEGFKPTNVAEWLQMRQADVQLLQTINQAGGSGESYRWVNAVIQLQRPAVAAIALGVWAWQEAMNPTGASEAAANFAATVGFYLFGDRTLFHIRRAAAPATIK